MGMDKIVVFIRNRLSLRKPQEESLNILANLSNKLSLAKSSPPILGGDTGVVNNQEKTIWLNSELAIVKEEYPTCIDFERDFPSMCFALATGVGKTRLMGAFIAYLYLTKGIRNFFVLAPNLTIYNKLIDDFSDGRCQVYVLQIFLKNVIDVRLENETVWLAQSHLCDLFQKSKATISEHIKNIFHEGELIEDSVVRKFRTTAKDGKSYDTRYYNAHRKYL